MIHRFRRLSPPLRTSSACDYVPPVSPIVVSALAQRAVQFALLTAVMLVAVSLLVLLEVWVLLCIGVTVHERPPEVGVSVVAFSLSRDGRWGASLVRISPGHWKDSPQWDILFHDLAVSGEPQRLDVGHRLPHKVAISPTGCAVAFVSQSSTVHTWSRHAGTLPLGQMESVAEEGLEHIVWSPDAQHLAASGRQCVYLWRASTGKLMHVARHSFRNPPCLAFSCDSEIVAAGGEGARVQLWRVASGEPLHEPPSDEERGACDASDPFGPYRVFQMRGIDVFVSNVQASESLGRVASAWPLSPSGPSSDAWTPVAVYDSTFPSSPIELRNACDGETQGELVGHPGRIQGVVYGPAGRLYSWDHRGVILGWDLATQRVVWRCSCVEMLAANRVGETTPSWRLRL